MQVSDTVYQNLMLSFVNAYQMCKYTWKNFNILVCLLFYENLIRVKKIVTKQFIVQLIFLTKKSTNDVESFTANALVTTAYLFFSLKFFDEKYAYNLRQLLLP